MSQLWRESGKQMPFSEFCDMINKGELDVYNLQNMIAENPKKKGYNSKKKYKEVYRNPLGNVGANNIKLGDNNNTINNPIVTQQNPIIICKPKQKEQDFSLLQVAALGLIIVGVIYLATNKSE